MDEKKNNKQVDYDKWRAEKIREIAREHACSYAEATIIFLLQDISYKLSVYYKKNE